MPKPKGKKKSARQDAKGKTEEADEVIPSNKIYVGNLSGLDITDEKLQKSFESCGDIRSANLVNTSNHAFGFVEFATVDEAELAIAELNGQSGMIVKFARSTSSPVCLNTSGQATEDSDEEEEEEAVLAPIATQDASVEQDDHETCTALLDLATARAAAARAYPSPIESLDSLMQKATRATSTKDYITYSFEEEDFGYVASVELLLPNGRRSCHSGESRDSKKDAKKSAALVALREPEVHRLLPPLPSKLREAGPAKSACVKAAKELPASDAELESQGEDEAKPGEEVEEKTGAVSAKDLRKHEKAELRAKKLARRKAAKAFKAALAEAEDEEETSDSAETDSAEDNEEDEEETTTDEDDEEDAQLDAAELAAKKAAIKAALAAKRRTAKGSRQTAANDDSKKKTATDPKKKPAHAHEPDFKMSDKVKDSKMQANFGQTKFIKP